MERFTISLDDHLATEFDALIAARGYDSRSEAIRDLLRSELDRNRVADQPRGQCVATLSYVFNHHVRDLAERLTAIQHAHHDLTVSAMHVHLDHDHCVETVILRGEVREVRQFTDALCTERGVHHGSVNVISAEQTRLRAKSESSRASGHVHTHGSGGRPHRHYKPVT